MQKVKKEKVSQETTQNQKITAEDKSKTILSNTRCVRSHLVNGHKVQQPSRMNLLQL